MPTRKKNSQLTGLLKKTREELKKLITVVEHVSDAVVITDNSRRVAYVNPATERMLGYRSSEMVGRPASCFFEGVPGNPPRLADKIASESGGVKDWDGEVFDRDKNGRVFPVRLKLAPIRNKVTLGYVGIASDLREARKNQHALTCSRETLGSVTDAVVIADGRGKIIYVNPAAEQMLGYYGGDLSRRRFSSLFDRSHPLPDILSGRDAPGEKMLSWQGESTLRRKTGEKFPASILIKKVLGDQRQAIGFFAVVKDMSLHRKLEDEIRQLKKMESVGLLTGGLAHDFNNFLQIILGNVESLKRQHRLSPNRLEAIEESARRASTLCQNLLAFAGTKRLPLEKVAPNELVEDTLFLLRRFLPARVSVRTEFSPDLPPVRCHPVQIQQVLLNLAINAVEAMKRGGDITISTAQVTLSSEAAAQHHAFRTGSYVRIGVTDRGPGMPPRILRRIFEPFFTTKSKTGKTGLGLTISYTIVRRHQGFMRVKSAVGRGTTFEVFLPA